MKTLMIVARDSTLSALEELMHDNGVNAYSLLNKVGVRVRRVRYTRLTSIRASLDSIL